MSKVKLLQSNFSSGELAETGYGRTDIARYANSAKILENVVVKSLGGAKKRFGTIYLGETKDMTKRARLVPYIVSRDEAYMLELGENYVRVFNSDGTRIMDGGSPMEVVTTFNANRVQELDYAQAEDAMWMFHQNFQPRRLRPYASGKWGFGIASFTAQPFAEIGDYPSVNCTFSSNTIGTGRTATASGAYFLASDVGRAILREDGIAVITAFSSSTVVTVEIKSVFPSAIQAAGSWQIDSSPQTALTPSAVGPVGATITLTLAAGGWRAADVGKYVRVNKGLCKISNFTSSTAVDAQVLVELSSVVAAPGLAWSLEASVWNSTYGYPRTGTLHEQRLLVAGTTKNPQTIWGSRSGEPFDFTIGVGDDAAFSFTLGSTSQSVNPIGFIVSSRNVLIMTLSGEFSMHGGVEKAITPTNVQIRPQSPHGAKFVRPVQVGKETLYVQRSGKKLRSMRFKYDEDGYISSDLTTLAEHLTQAGIAGAAFQQVPDPIVWVWLENGGLVSITLDRELEIIGWARHKTSGGVESVAVLPAGDADQVWLVVRRTVNGATVRYVERMEESWYPIYGTSSIDLNAIPPDEGPVNWGYTLDCAITDDSATPSSTWTGLDHLEGCTVRCVADGADVGDYVVTSGSITIPRSAQRVLIGLPYAPRIVLLSPEIQGGGTIQADAMCSNEITVRLHQTIDCLVNGIRLELGRKTGVDKLGNAPSLFTGDKVETVRGWDKGKSEIEITQEAACPFHLLAVIRNLTVNGG